MGSYARERARDRLADLAKQGLDLPTLWQESNEILAVAVRSTPDGVYYYTGKGARLNDKNGTERDQFDHYLPRSSACHRGWNAGSSAEFPAAKRPRTTGYYPLRVVPNSPIAWRAVTPLPIANE
jgi:hypothetical protein